MPINVWSLNLKGTCYWKTGDKWKNNIIKEDLKEQGGSVLIEFGSRSEPMLANSQHGQKLEGLTKSWKFLIEHVPSPCRVVDMQLAEASLVESCKNLANTRADQ